jgi:23S rRNA (cytidine1920-2'-O)/16S rRNA (cytidine1409-2'-O)-methyltransferase
VSRRPLDVELVRRGLVASATEAQEAVRTGRVSVRGVPATKTTTLVAPDEAVAVAGESRAFVSRGGEKLSAALGAFGMDPSGRDALDAGASTGGFTDCLLQRGVRHVIAVDVGYGQLAWELRTDPRVTVMDRTNVRDLVAEALPFRPSLVTADLSFVSLGRALEPLLGVASPTADLLLLIKPQFEADRDEVGPGGVVRDPDVWRRAIERIDGAARAGGAGPLAVIASPIKGPAGNVEFFLHARAGEAGVALALDGAIRDGLEVGR